VKVIKQSVFGVPNVTEFKNVLTDLTKKSAQKLVMNGIYMFCIYSASIYIQRGINLCTRNNIKATRI
jgi:hypothetical protein